MKRILFAPIIIAVLAAGFASHSPDGLERVAETLGFAGKAVKPSGCMQGYCVHFLGNSKLSAICAGIVGLWLVYGIFWLIRSILKRPKAKIQSL